MSVSSVGSSTNSLQALVAQSAKNVSTDPRDTNHDGKVSAAEALAYSQTHPDLTKKVETAEPTPSAKQGSLDLSV
jgi:hypothetical protein